MMILKEFSRIVCVSLFSYQGSYVLPSFPKADAKVRDFIVTTKCFRKFFLKKFFFRNFHKRRDVHPPQVLSVLAPLAPLR